MSSKINQFAFTLVELLIVIAIIGIISTVTVTTLNNAKAKARDARRISDITQIVKALEIYYYFEGQYPGYDACLIREIGELSGCSSLAANPSSAWILDLTKYLDQPLPIDPINYQADGEPNPGWGNSYFYFYSRTAEGKGYYILYRLESQGQTTCPKSIDGNFSCKFGGDAL